VKFCWEVFVALLMITDPPGIVPVFPGVTGGHPANATGSAGRADKFIGPGIKLTRKGRLHGSAH
jgi:small neutral amino acid transporter SnatA (MarC family)